MSFSLGKNNILTGAEDFSRFRTARIVKINSGKIRFVSNSNGVSRIGISVMRKTKANSVLRNTVKRLVRENFRYNKQSLQGLDVFVIIENILEKQALHEDLKNGFLAVKKALN